MVSCVTWCAVIGVVVVSYVGCVMMLNLSASSVMKGWSMYVYYGETTGGAG